MPYQPPPAKPGKGKKKQQQQQQQQQFPKYKDEKKTGTAKRFLGDTLAGRFVRSAVQTASSTWKLPESLSPWGDNNRFVCHASEWWVKPTGSSLL